MAAWQFNVVFLPASGVPLEKQDVIALYLEDRAPAWNGTSAAVVTAALAAELDAVASPFRVEWSSELMWGEPDRTNVRLDTEADIVLDFYMRLDLRDPRAALPTACFKAANELGFVIVTEHGNIVPSDIDRALALAERSPAAKFVRDPRTFFRSLKGPN